MFVIKVLGGLTIESTSASMPPGARQRRRLSLLALLALAGERGLSRERIQSYLWPESESSRARHALDQLLYATRRELGSEAITSSATDLRLNPAVVGTDVWAFDEAILDERWKEATGLYAGPVLSGQHLADCAELERWIDVARAQREHDYLRALDALATAAARRGDRMDAVRWRRRHAVADPVSGPVALDLMRALDAAGDRAGAIQHARVHQQIVRATLDVEPDPAVASLAEILAARSTASLVPPAPRAPSVPNPADSSDSSDSSPAGSAVEVAAAPPMTAAKRWRTGARRTNALVAGLAGLALVVVVRSPALQSASTGASIPTRGVTSSVAQRSDRRPAGESQTADAEARALYLRARVLWERRTKEPLEQAVVLFRQATERDPTYAAAYAGLAESYAMLGYFGFAPGDAMFPKARAAALRAIELDPSAGDAYAALGQALAWEHAWGESEAAYRRALELVPADATAHQWYALLLAYLGRAQEAATHTAHASRLDPLSVQVNNMHGMMLYYAGDSAGALQQYERTVNAEPDSAWVRRNPWVLTNFSRVAAASGRHALAVRLVERALEAVPSHPRPLFDLAYAYVASGSPDSARAAFARVDSTHAHYAVYRALFDGLLGDQDVAFEWFDRVGEWPLPALVTLNCEPRLATLRADPRFERVRSQLNMRPN